MTDLDLDVLEASILNDPNFRACVPTCPSGDHEHYSLELALIERVRTAEAAIREEIEYLGGFRPDHAEHLMLLVGKSLERLRGALGGDQT